MEIEIGKVYRHFLGEYYKVVGIALYADYEMEFVIYHSVHNPNQLFMIPKEKFFNTVLSFGKQDRRFVLVGWEE